MPRWMNIFLSWEQAPKALGWVMRCWESPPRLPAVATPPMEGIFKGAAHAAARHLHG